MPLSLSQRLQAIYRAFYRDYDDPPRLWYYVKEVYDDSVVIWEEGDHGRNAHFRVPYTWPNSPPVQGDEPTFAAAAEWVQVEQMWTEVERSAADVEKRALLDALVTRAAEDAPEVSAETSTGTPEHLAIGSRHVAAVTARLGGNDERSTFTISTEIVDRHGTVIDIATLSVTNYRRNGVVLWHHGRDPQRGALPIGRLTNLYTRAATATEAARLVAEVEWYTDDFSQNVARMVRDGFLNATSIGFLQHQAPTRVQEGDRIYYRVEGAELVEFSVVAVPSNPGALVEQRADEAFVARVAALEQRLAALEATPGAARSDAAPVASATTAAPAAPASAANEAAMGQPGLQASPTARATAPPDPTAQAFAALAGLHALQEAQRAHEALLLKRAAGQA